MGFIKKQFEKTAKRIKTYWKQKALAQAEARRKARGAYFKAKQEHAIRLAKAKTKYEAEFEEKKLKVKYSPKQNPIKRNLKEFSKGLGIKKPTKKSLAKNLQRNGFVDPAYNIK